MKRKKKMYLRLHTVCFCVKEKGRKKFINSTRIYKKQVTVGGKLV